MLPRSILRRRIPETKIKYAICVMCIMISSFLGLQPHEHIPPSGLGIPNSHITAGLLQFCAEVWQLAVRTYGVHSLHCKGGRKTPIWHPQLFLKSGIALIKPEHPETCSSFPRRFTIIRRRASRYVPSVHPEPSTIS